MPDMIRFLRDTLIRVPRSQAMSVTELFERSGVPRAMLCLFLAILELVKRQAIHLQQREAFADIMVQAADNFEEALGSEQAIAAAEQEYN